MNSPPCAFTVDVEDYFQVDAFSRVIAPSDWDSFSSRVVANTGRLLDLLDRHQVHGYVLCTRLDCPAASGAGALHRGPRA
jgi:hypothetical protein